MNIIEKAARDLADAEETLAQIRTYRQYPGIQDQFGIALDWTTCCVTPEHKTVVEAVRKQIVGRMQTILSDAEEDARTEMQRARLAMHNALEQAKL